MYIMIVNGWKPLTPQHKGLKCIQCFLSPVAEQNMNTVPFVAVLRSTCLQSVFFRFFMHRGYIKFWRKIEDNPRFKDPEYFALWGWLLLKANHKERKEIFGNETIICKPGQFTTGRKQLSAISGICESKIQRLLNLMKIEQQIEQRTTSVNRLISICNWDKHQSSEQRFEQQVNNERTTTEQRVNTLQECKNVIMKENTIPIWHDNYSEYKKIELSAYNICSQKYELKNRFQKIYPDGNFDRTLLKCQVYWQSEAGWETKKEHYKAGIKRNKNYEIDMIATYSKAVTEKFNIIYNGKNTQEKKPVYHTPIEDLYK